MTWTVKEVVGLPVLEDREVYTNIVVPVPTGEIIRKEPGDKITKAEMEAAGQTEEDIQKMIDVGGIEEDV